MDLARIFDKIDLTLVLVLALLFTAVIWLLDRFVLAPRRTARGEDPAAPQPWYIDLPRSLFPMLFVVVALRSFVVEPFRIPSGSMLPTLTVGDFIAVNKFAYGLRLPVLNVKIVPIGTPQRGDVIVFRYPEDPSEHFIKRVIGLPGDRIHYEDRTLTINGQKIARELVSAQVPKEAFSQLWREHLEGVDHSIYLMPSMHMMSSALEQQAQGPWDVTVPAGHYFVMGDNRDNSRDSRFWGFVPDENIVGRTFAVWMHWDGGLPSFSSLRAVH